MHRNMKKIQHYMKLHRIIMFVVHVINIFILETGRGSVMTEIIQIKDLKVHYPFAAASSIESLIMFWRLMVWIS